MTYLILAEDFNSQTGYCLLCLKFSFLTLLIRNFDQKVKSRKNCGITNTNKLLIKSISVSCKWIKKTCLRKTRVHDISSLSMQKKLIDIFRLKNKSLVIGREIQFYVDING